MWDQKICSIKANINRLQLVNTIPQEMFRNALKTWKIASLSYSTEPTVIWQTAASLPHIYPRNYIHICTHPDLIPGETFLKLLFLFGYLDPYLIQRSTDPNKCAHLQTASHAIFAQLHRQTHMPCHVQYVQEKANHQRTEVLHANNAAQK